MNILTKRNELLKVELDRERVEVEGEGVVFWKKGREYRAVGSEEYLEIEGEKTTRIHLFRKIEDVLVIGDRIYLVGDRWIEYLERSKLVKEREFAEKIVGVGVFEEMIVVLQQERLLVLDRRLKDVGRTRISVRYPEKLLITEDKIMGILSATEKTVFLFTTSGSEIKKIRTEGRPSAFAVFKENGETYVAVAHGTKIRVEGVTRSFEREAETDHVTGIFEVKYSEKDKAIYSASKEGIVCRTELERGDGEAVYVESAGIEKIDV